jgi:hypothetical protein
VSIIGFWHTGSPVDARFLEALNEIVPVDVAISVQKPFQDRTLILPVEPGQKLKDLPYKLQSLPHPESATIRPKRVNHLSLAYGSGYTPSSEYLSLAQEVFNDLKVLNCSEWEIIFFERIFKSLNNSSSKRGSIEPHGFKEIQKWKISSSQIS